MEAEYEDLVFDTLPWAADAHECEDKLREVIGGVGSGKSVWGADELIEGILQYPHAHHYYMGADKVAMREGTTLTLEERLDDYGIGVRVNKQSLNIEIATGIAKGTEVVATSSAVYRRLKGQMIDRIWCDEAQEWLHGSDTQGGMAYDFLITRLRPSEGAQKHHPGMQPRLWLTANPPHRTSHWIYQKFVIDKVGTLFHVTTLDNPILHEKDPTYLETLRTTLSPEVYAIEVLGQWGDLGVGRAYTSFDRERGLKPDPRLPSLRRNPDGSLWRDTSGRYRIALDPSRALVWSQDFGVQPRASVICQVHAGVHVPGFQRQLVYVLDAIEIPDGSTDVMIKEFVRRYPAEVVDEHGGKHRRKVYVYGDPAGRTRNSTTAVSDWAYMKQHPLLKPYDIEYHYDASAPHPIDRVAATNAKLCNAANEIGTLFDPGDGRERVAAQLLMGDLQKTAWKPGTRLLDHGSPAKGLFQTHLSDALGYFVAKSWPIVLRNSVRVVGSGATAR